MKADGFAEKRKQLVEAMCANGAVRTASVKEAFLKVKREIFFPKESREFAYFDEAFPIGFGQTISQPSTIATMLEMLGAEKGHKVLEVGAGSAYVLALLSEIVGPKGKVFGFEIVPELKELAEKNLKQLHCKNIKVIVGDGTLGLRQKAPFDRILVSAACPKIPEPLLGQLKEGGRAVAPIGNRFSQEMVLLEKTSGEAIEKQRLCCFVFVPLLGKFGWQ